MAASAGKSTHKKERRSKRSGALLFVIRGRSNQSC